MRRAFFFVSYPCLLYTSERFKDYKGIHCNAQMTERMIHQFAEPDEQGIELLRMAMERNGTDFALDVDAVE